MSSDPKIIGIKTYLFETFSQRKALENFSVKIRQKWAIIAFFRSSKILGETGKQEILQQMFRKF